MDARTRPAPSWAGLPWLGKLGPRARIRDLGQPWTPVRFWTRGPIGDALPSPPLPSPSGPVPLPF